MNSEDSIVKLFDSSILSTSHVLSLTDWLKKTPKRTTIRVNLMRTSLHEVRIHILKALEECNLPRLPLIEEFEPIPEMIIINSIDESLICPEPRSDSKEVVVDLQCAAAILRGANIYGPGILAMQSNTKLNELVNIYADIEGTCKKGTNVVFNSSRKLFIGIGLVKMQRFQLFGTDTCSKGIGIRVEQTISCVPSIGSDFLKDTFCLLQNFPSIVCSRVLDPKPNEIILDMCASPGNKTSHIAQLMKDSGRLIALDKSAKRVEILKENIQRFKFNSVSCFVLDATKSVSVESKSIDCPPFPEESFDKILLDAPCSGSGNRPALSTKMNSKVFTTFPKLQKKLLETAVKLLKVGGVLVYSTCSVHEAENEMNIAYILAKYGEQLELEYATPLFGYPGLPHVGLNDEQRQKVQRFGPNFEQIHERKFGSEFTGFFISRFKKIL